MYGSVCCTYYTSLMEPSCLYKLLLCQIPYYTLRWVERDMCILPVLTYGAQTWSLTNLQKSALKVCQRVMERSIFSGTKIADVSTKVATLKWDWAEHVCRMPKESWAKSSTTWIPNSKRRISRPKRR